MRRSLKAGAEALHFRTSVTLPCYIRDQRQMVRAHIRANFTQQWFQAVSGQHMVNPGAKGQATHRHPLSPAIAKAGFRKSIVIAIPDFTEQWAVWRSVKISDNQQRQSNPTQIFLYLRCSQPACFGLSFQHFFPGRPQQRVLIKHRL